MRAIFLIFAVALASQANASNSLSCDGWLSDLEDRSSPFTISIGGNSLFISDGNSVREYAFIGEAGLRHIFGNVNSMVAVDGINDRGKFNQGSRIVEMDPLTPQMARKSNCKR